LLEIEKTAVKLASMDKSEATPVVIEVCTETAELLNTTVLYAIIEEDAADRASLQAAYDGFEQWETQRQQAEDALEEAEAIVTQRAAAMSTCYIRETETCVNETICTTEENDHCTDRDRVERELQIIDEEIHNSWCESGEIRTSTEFRQTTVEVFRRYTEKLTELERLQLLCDEVLEHCETTLSTYIETATQCNTKMAELQMASCSYHHVASGELRLYQEGFLAALAFYNDVVARVMIEEADRKVEWDVLTRVICLLLTLTNEEDGVVSGAETEARIQRCWDDFVDVSHLDIDYLDPPEMLSLPELPPLPCTAEYDSHYQLDTPAACIALEEEHNTQATSVCTCLADEVENQGIILGHFLLVDPAVPMTVANNGAGMGWTIDMDGQTYTGQISAPVAAPGLAALSQTMLTDDQLAPMEADGTTENEDYTGPIAYLAWAYPSVSADWSGAMSLGQRFASRGGMIFLNQNMDVIEVRETASSSGPLGQPVSATMSFSSAEEISEEQAAAACPYEYTITEHQRWYAQGARKYCWAIAASLPQCANGCFIYETVTASGTGRLAFPMIDGLHLIVSPTLAPGQ
jgi:hypothetical protein